MVLPSNFRDPKSHSNDVYISVWVCMRNPTLLLLGFKRSSHDPKQTWPINKSQVPTQEPPYKTLNKSNVSFPTQKSKIKNQKKKKRNSFPLKLYSATELINTRLQTTLSLSLSLEFLELSHLLFSRTSPAWLLGSALSAGSLSLSLSEAYLSLSVLFLWLDFWCWCIFYYV